jgi:Fe-S cluster biosynthesis and repair protein YggX
MPQMNPRLEQFRKMAEADPNNELGHFSLAREYQAEGMNEEAVKSYQRVLELNPNISKAYHLLGKALLDLSRRDQAIARLSEGVKIAHERGDFAPKTEMTRMLKELSAPVPEFASAAPQRAASEGEVTCSRCGRVGKRLSTPPFSNAFGKEVQEKICADCWREWIGMGTKVINELRLPLSDPQAQKMFDQHMREFLNL